VHVYVRINPVRVGTEDFPLVGGPGEHGGGTLEDRVPKIFGRFRQGKAVWQQEVGDLMQQVAIEERVGEEIMQTRLGCAVRIRDTASYAQKPQGRAHVGADRRKRSHFVAVDGMGCGEVPPEILHIPLMALSDVSKLRNAMSTKTLRPVGVHMIYGPGVRACVRACVGVWVCGCMHACVRACVRAYIIRRYVRSFLVVYVCMGMYVLIVY
jgi:hypothetical protein